MKKLFLALLMLGTMTTIQAQSSKVINLKDITTQKTLDTITNAGARTLRGQIPSYNDVVTVQVNITKISGTVAGSVVLSGSVDGVGYTAIGSAFTATNVASQSASFSVNPSIYQYYQITYTGTGTMAASMSAPVLYRQK